MKTLSIALLSVMILQSNSTRPLPDRAKSRQAVAATAWGKSITQIPSTVIDKGVLRNIPYLSYRAGEYELNVYGDPAAPACVEIGINKELLTQPQAKKNCIDLMTGLLADPADRALIATLKLDVDKKVRNELTFEITPPTAEDAYGAWWISIYNEAALDRSRATPDEMAKITVPLQNVKGTKPSEGPMVADGATQGKWGAEDLAQARAQKGVSEEKQAVYSPTISRKNGVYVPDRTADDTGYIMFVCANSDKHEDREEILKNCPTCKGEDTYFWDTPRACFIGFKCGEVYDNALVKCSGCGKAPRKVRTKHK